MTARDPGRTTRPAFSEERRQVIHMAMGAFALLLRFLSWWQAALCAVAAFAFNLLVLPRLDTLRLARPEDRTRGYSLGILAYPLSVLLLILWMPARLDLVASAWAIMAVGDGAATLVGRRSSRARLPWNPDKTVAGSIAFLVAGAAAAALAGLWVRPTVVPVPPVEMTLAGAGLAAALAALVESMRVRLDDNISVPISAGLVLWSLGLMTPDAWGAAASGVASRIVPALALNLPIATLGWLARTVSPPGAVAGAVIGVLVYATTGPGGWLLLFASFFVAAASSRMGLSRKSLLGIAEEREGRRGPGNAIANCALAAWAGLLAAATPHREWALLAFVAALAAAGSDTVASEIGKAWGRRTFLVPTFTLVRPGTPGAVSLEGTAAGLVAALGLVAIGVAVGLIGGSLFWFAVVGATIGAFVESALGATLEPIGIMNNDLLNFLNTAVAAASAIALARVLM